MANKYSITLLSFVKAFPAAVFLSRWCTVRDAIQTTLLLLSKPWRYYEFERKNLLVAPYYMLVLCFVSALVKFSYDTNLYSVSAWLNLSQSFVPVFVFISAYTSVLGAIAVPMFWYHVLGIRIDRDLFVAAMIRAYAAVSIPWDALYPFYHQTVAGSSAHWLPDTIKTIIVTVYCWVIAASLKQVQQMESVQKH